LLLYEDRLVSPIESPTDELFDDGVHRNVTAREAWSSYASY
jgi:hypothetical protein